MSAPTTATSIPIPEKPFLSRLASKCMMDKIGIWLSATCAVHCAALPLLLTFSGLGFLEDERLEWGIIAMAFTIGTLRLFHSYFQEHRKADSILLFLIGAASILFAKADLLEWEYAEPGFMTIGGLLIASAHWRNHRLAHSLPGHRH